MFFNLKKTQNIYLLECLANTRWSLRSRWWLLPKWSFTEIQTVCRRSHWNANRFGQNWAERRRLCWQHTSSRTRFAGNGNFLIRLRGNKKKKKHSTGRRVIICFMRPPANAQMDCLAVMETAITQSPCFRKAESFWWILSVESAIKGTSTCDDYRVSYFRMKTYKIYNLTFYHLFYPLFFGVTHVTAQNKDNFKIVYDVPDFHYSCLAHIYEGNKKKKKRKQGKIELVQVILCDL